MAAEIKTEQQLKIMRQYAAGAELVDIGERLGIDRDTVAGTVSTLAGFVRGRARELVRQYEAAHPRPAAPAPPTAPQQIDVPVLARTPEPPLGAEVVLVRAERAGGRYATKAGRIRALVAALEVDLAEAERVIAQERRIQDLKAQLERETAKLRELRSGGAKPATSNGSARTAASGSDPTTREVREWAAANGVPCPSKGRFLPASVLEAYHAAHSEVSGG